uniref:Protein kinase domain-containing protein n=1 Tax=Panagrolaimus sp. PS1159 TaxID=55785 RepID=A0AC35G4Z4_9BILA
MELKTLSNCIISGIETACFKLCKTCSETSHCGNPNACTSCYPGDNKVSENIDDKFFQCSKECDVIQIRLDDGSYFCPSPTESSTLKFLTETTEANSLVSKSSKHVESNTTWTIFIAIVFLGVIIIIALWISRKNALKKTISNNHFQEICVTNKKSFISPSSNISKSLIKPSFTKQVAPEKTKTSLEVIMNNKDFEKGKKLRGGNYSTVFEGTLRGEIVAIKVARKEGKKNIYKELQVYEKVEHPSIIKALGY